MSNTPEAPITIFTDGSSLGNPGPGGYGTLLVWGDYRKDFSGGYRLTTNNRMELMAVIVGLEAIRRKNCEVRIYSDSKYVVDAVNKGWIYGWIKKRFKGVKNQDLWMRFLTIFQQHKVTFIWVKGHAEVEGNEICDRLAVAAARGTDLLVDQGYEQEHPTVVMQ